MTLKQIAIRLLDHHAPRLMSERLRPAWHRRYVRAGERRMGLPALAREFVALHGSRVLAGPFAGMDYVAESAGSSYVPKLLGSYELELHGIIETLVARGTSTVIDVGCAEGYYAVGLARHLPAASIVAFDIDPHARRLCRHLADLNCVGDRVAVRSACDHASLSVALVPGAVVVCDCEGYEYELLRPDAVPGLARAAMLVELHGSDGGPGSPGAPAGRLAEFLARFGPTHDSTVIRATSRDPDHFPALDFLAPERRAAAVYERTEVEQPWAWLTPKGWNSA